MDMSIIKFEIPCAFQKIINLFDSIHVVPFLQSVKYGISLQKNIVLLTKCKKISRA